jgi:Uma2 family endonuclease
MAEIESAAPATTIPPLPSAPQKLITEPDPCIVLHDISWERYRAISDALTECHVRLTYDRGRLELMTKSRRHDSLSRFLYRLIIILTEETGLLVGSCGGMTCDREDLLRGLEPDECFYIANEPRMRGKEIVHFPTDPPPDLALEIDVTRNSLGRLPIYAALGVPEVWRYDGDAVTFYRLTEGNYAAIEKSDNFPFLAPAAILDILRQWRQTDENSLARSFRQWVRQQVGAKS